MVGQCFACLLAAFWFYISILSVHVIIYKNVVLACLQNTKGLTMCQLRIFSKFASGCKFPSFGRQPDANLVQSVAIGMQISFSQRQPDANCIRLAAMQIASGQRPCNTKYSVCMRPAINQMKFASCWQLAESKFCRNKWLAHC